MKIKKGILYKIAKWEQLGSDIDTSCGLITELCVKAFVLLLIAILIPILLFGLYLILFFMVGLYETNGAVFDLLSDFNPMYRDYRVGLILSLATTILLGIVYLPESKLIKRLIKSIKDKTCFKIEWVDKT
jgi:hypothetical protein